MVNAGLVIRGFDGQQRFDSDVNMWVGIGIKVNYPSGQNATDNPVAEGDVMIEQNGDAWKIEQAETEDVDQNYFRVAVSSMTGETTGDKSPSLTSTSRGAITTPRKGFIAAYWDPGLVSQEASRMAQILTMENLEIPEPQDELPDEVWSGTVELT